MTALENEEQSALTQLRAFLAQEQPPLNGRLPPERALCKQLGVTRVVLRKVLATLEAEGQLWRHVGKGTFVGPRPLEGLTDIKTITSQTNPAEVMQTRVLIEPEISRLAALNATAQDLDEMRLCMAKSRTATSWRQYESWDNRLHRVIAESAQNKLLLALFDSMNLVRRAVVWGRLRNDKLKPDPDHHSFTEHERIVAAIAERDMDSAAENMRRHLESVERNLLQRRGNGEDRDKPGGRA